MSVELKDVYNKLRNGQLVSEAAEKLGVLEIVLIGMIEKMQLEGNDIGIFYKNGKSYIRKRIVHRKSRTIKEEISELELIKLAVLGDTHMGHKRQQLQLVNRFFVTAYERGYRRFLHLGDITDGHYINKRGEHPYECFAQGYDEQLDNVVNTWPEVEGVEMDLIGGNHDFTFYREIGADIGKEIARLRPDIVYHGFDKATIYVGKNKNVPIKMQHPDKGSTDVTSTRIQKSIEKLDTVDNPKVVFQGHYHRYYNFTDRNMEGFLVPCFLGGSIFIDRCELPNDIGGILYDMYVDKSGSVQYTEYEPILYSKEEVEVDSYKKIKKLVIK